MAEVDIISRLDNEPLWLESYRSLVVKVLELEKLSNWEISVTLCHDPCIKDLNSRFRHRDEATDVLSFCQNEGPEMAVFPNQPRSAGDIVISMDTLARHSELYVVDLEEELRRVTIHGILHLKGMSHKTRNPREKMLLHQERILKKTKEFKVF